MPRAGRRAVAREAGVVEGRRADVAAAEVTPEPAAPTPEAPAARRHDPARIMAGLDEGDRSRAAIEAGAVARAGLSAEECLALCKGVESWSDKAGLKELDRAMKPGQYAVSRRFVVEVRGALKRERDTEAIPTSAIPMIPAIALILEKSGITAEASKRMLRDALREAFTLGTDPGEKIRARMEEVGNAIEEVKEVVRSLPKVPRKGALKAILEVDVRPAE